jgi:hypothetical protein
MSSTLVRAQRCHREQRAAQLCAALEPHTRETSKCLNPKLKQSTNPEDVGAQELPASILRRQRSDDQYMATVRYLIAWAVLNTDPEEEETHSQCPRVLTALDARLPALMSSYPIVLGAGTKDRLLDQTEGFRAGRLNAMVEGEES